MMEHKFGQGDKVAIIGAKGNLGSQMARVLGNEYRLLLWDRDEIDVTDAVSVEKKIIDHKPHFIINCAAYNAVDKCEESDTEFALAKKLNGAAVGYLADAALKINAVLVHFSTDYVFSGNTDKGYKEDSLPGPVSKYGESKLSGETELLKRAEKGLNYYIVRTSKLFGPKGESELAKPGFFDIMLKLAKEKGEVRVIDEETSCFTYTLDLAKAVKALIESKRPYGIYHLANAGAVTWFVAAKTLFKLAGIKAKAIPITSNEYPRPAKRPANSVLLNTKLPPLRPYEEALKEYLSSL